MNIAKVAEAMHSIVERTDLPLKPDYCTKEHLYYMLTQISTHEVTGDKAHRWLGYVQGIVAIQGGASLDELKALNR